MIITFPHLGNMYIGIKALFDGLSIDYVIPPFSNKTSLEIGSLHSPEEMCLPFKINLGNYIQSIEQGADTVIITGSCGPCRFGEYCELQMLTLKKLGYPVDFIVIDSPHDIGLDTLFERIKKIGITSNKTRIEKYQAVYTAIRIQKLLDTLESKVYHLSGYEIKNGDCKKLLKNCKSDLIACDTPQKMISTLNTYMKRLKNVPVNLQNNPIKIAIIGEIYTIIEPFTNLNIEEKLMDYGVSSYRNMTASWWIKDTLLKPLKLNGLDIKRASREYLSLGIGGHARECVGEAVIASEQGYDGAIQIFPMGCMPEIVAKPILSTIARDKSMPIMTLVVDEMTGEAGYITRIEAFIDMLERRKEKCII